MLLQFFLSGNKIEVISFWILFDLKYSLYLSANLLLAQQEHFFDHCQKEPSLSLSLSHRPSYLASNLVSGLQIKDQDLLLLFEYFNDENGNFDLQKI